MPMSIKLRDDFDVELVESSGSDEGICRAARVSTLGLDSIETSESQGLLSFLARNRHGSPFEHASMTFRITAPIFVWREFMRHRIGFSYNEQSGRYMTLSPIFYLPNIGRPLVQEGKAGSYSFVDGSIEQYDICIERSIEAYRAAWVSYKAMGNAGIANEVCRQVLPVAVYSSAYVTCNPRSLMSFLSLRTKDVTSMFPSYPQYEINKVADQMEAIFAELYPLSHKAFCAAGRVSP